MSAIRCLDIRTSWVYVSLLTMTLTACGGGNSESTAALPPTSFASVRAVELTDTEIAQLLYADNKRTPTGFYKEPPLSYPGYVATLHLKNTDLPGAANPAQFELCTNDWTVALDWSDQAAAAMSGSTLIETNATSRYQEFIRLRLGTPQGYVRTRVYRCDYLDRSAVDLHSASGAAGSFNQRPLTAEDLQQLAEYLWQFTTYDNYGNAVLKSSGQPTANGMQHTLVIASLPASSDANGCDRIEVISWTHSLDTQTGILVRSVDTLWEFGAKQSAGLVELCNPS